MLTKSRKSDKFKAALTKLLMDSNSSSIGEAECDLNEWLWWLRVRNDDISEVTMYLCDVLGVTRTWRVRFNAILYHMKKHFKTHNLIILLFRLLWWSNPQYKMTHVEICGAKWSIIWLTILFTRYSPCSLLPAIQNFGLIEKNKKNAVTFLFKITGWELIKVLRHGSQSLL